MPWIPDLPRHFNLFCHLHADHGRHAHLSRVDHLPRQFHLPRHVNVPWIHDVRGNLLLSRHTDLSRVEHMRRIPDLSRLPFLCHHYMCWRTHLRHVGDLRRHDDLHRLHYLPWIGHLSGYADLSRVLYLLWNRNVRRRADVLGEPNLARVPDLRGNDDLSAICDL